MSLFTVQAAEQVVTRGAVDLKKQSRATLLTERAAGEKGRDKRLRVVRSARDDDVPHRDGEPSLEVAPNLQAAFVATIRIGLRGGRLLALDLVLLDVLHFRISLSFSFALVIRDSIAVLAPMQQRRCHARSPMLFATCLRSRVVDVRAAREGCLARRDDSASTRTSTADREVACC
jgi:hypothetical protein